MTPCPRPAAVAHAVHRGRLRVVSWHRTVVNAHSGRVASHSGRVGKNPRAGDAQCRGVSAQRGAVDGKGGVVQRQRGTHIAIPGNARRRGAHAICRNGTSLWDRLIACHARHSITFSTAVTQALPFSAMHSGSGRRHLPRLRPLSLPWPRPRTRAAVMSSSIRGGTNVSRPQQPPPGLHTGNRLRRLLWHLCYWRHVRWAYGTGHGIVVPTVPSAINCTRTGGRSRVRLVQQWQRLAARATPRRRATGRTPCRRLGAINRSPVRHQSRPQSDRRVLCPAGCHEIGRAHV